MLKNTMLLKMVNKILGFLFVMFLLESCNSSLNNSLPGFEFELFQETPVWELAKAVKKEDVKKINDLLKDSNIKVDYQELKFGNTLLILAVANEKFNSAEALLINGGNPNLPDFYKHDNAVTTLCRDLHIEENCDTSILSLVLRHGGNVNYQLKYVDSLYGEITTNPLRIATYAGKCLNFIRVLVDHGADINEYNSEPNNTPVAGSIFSESLDVAKYLLMEKKARIPEYCFIRPKGEKPYEQKITITQYLNEKQYKKGSANYKLREEIITYLKSKKLK